jgi:hypothetical protein
MLGSAAADRAAASSSCCRCCCSVAAGSWGACCCEDGGIRGWEWLPPSHANGSSNSSSSVPYWSPLSPWSPYSNGKDLITVNKGPDYDQLDMLQHTRQ